MDVLTTYKPLVSIVLTCYNGEKFLPRCFESIDGQTYKNLEVVFVNDGSQDGSLKLLQDYCAKHDKYKVLDGVNQGVGSAKKKGISAVTGEYLLFCDVDDILEPCHVEYLLDLMLKHDAHLSISKFCMVKAKKVDEYPKIDPEFVKKGKKSKIILYDKISGMQQFFSQEKFDYTLPSKMFKMDLVRQSGATLLEGCRYGEETPFIYNYMTVCDRIVYGELPTYRYVQWKSSLMHASFNKNRLDLYTNINSYIDDCKEKYPEVYPYIHSMRAGYAVGFLYFILKSKFNEPDVIKLIINLLNADCKYLKKCKKTALYKRIFIPVVLFIAKIRFRKALKQK